MSTVSTPAVSPLRRGRWFALALLLAMIVLIAYKHSALFFVPWLFRPPDFSSAIIHMHVAIVASWILLLLLQIVLVRAGRVAWHRRLGTAGMALAVLMLLFGILATADMLAREPDALARSIVPITQILSFAVFVALAYWKRTDREAHRRLMLLAMVDPVFGVLVPYSHQLFGSADRFLNLSWIFLLFLAANDLWTRRRLHPVTLWGSLGLMLLQDVRGPLGQTGVWLAIAHWMRAWGV